MSDKRIICYDPICFLGDTAFVAKKGGAWTGDVEAWKKHLAPIANAGANAVRIMPWSVWGDRPEGRTSQFSPYVLVGDKWDLAQINDYYFPIVKAFIHAANDYGMIVWWCFADDCQFSGPYKQYSPWHENIQGLDSCYDAGAYPFFKTWMKRCYAEFDGLNVNYHFGNEMNDPRFVALAQNAIFPVIKELGIPFDRLGYGAHMQDAPYNAPPRPPKTPKYGEKVTIQDTVRKNFGVFFPPEPNKMKVIREVHGCGNLGDADRPFGDRVEQALTWWDWKVAQGPGAYVGEFICSTDGQKHGDSKCDKDFDGARPSADTMYKMARYIWGRADNAHIAHCPQTSDTDCLALTFGAISKAYQETFGKWPANYGKVAYIPPVPPQPPDPPTPPEPPAPKSCYEKYIKGRPMRLWQVGKWILCKLGL